MLLGVKKSASTSAYTTSWLQHQHQQFAMECEMAEFGNIILIQSMTGRITCLEKRGLRRKLCSGFLVIFQKTVFNRIYCVFCFWVISPRLVELFSGQCFVLPKRKKTRAKEIQEVPDFFIETYSHSLNAFVFTFWWEFYQLLTLIT